MKNYFALLVVAVLTIMLMAACGTKTQLVEVTRLVERRVTQIVTVEVEKEVTREVLVEPTTASAPEAGKLAAHVVGEVVQIYKFNMTLNSVQVNDGILTANFTIENISDKVGTASKFDFVAKNSEDIKLEDEYYECKPEISSQLAPGDKTKGNICWKGATGDTFKIQYTIMDDDYNAVISVWAVTIE